MEENLVLLHIIILFRQITIKLEIVFAMSGLLGLILCLILFLNPGQLILLSHSHILRRGHSLVDRPVNHCGGVVVWGEVQVEVE